MAETQKDHTAANEENRSHATNVQQGVKVVIKASRRFTLMDVSSRTHFACRNISTAGALRIGSHGVPSNHPPINV